MIDADDDHAIQRGERTETIKAANSETGSLYTLFEQQVRRTPDRLALKLANADQPTAQALDGQSVDQAWTYAELSERVNQLAKSLQRQNIGKGQAVGVLIERSLPVYVAVLAVLQTGAAYVPLDPSYPQKRLDYMANSAGLSTIVTSKSVADTLQNKSLNYLLIDSDGRLQDNLSGAGQSTVTDLSVNQQAGSHKISLCEDCAYVMFTSGSTGMPKAVVATHQATINRLQWMWERFPFAATDICCQKTALSFVDSVWEIFGPLLRGVPTVVIPQQSLTDVIEFVDILEQEQISRLVLVPTLLGLLLNTHRDLGSRLHKLTLCTVSGEPLPRDTASRFFASMPGTTLLNLYGSTEVSADVTYDIVSSEFTDAVRWSD